MLDYFANIARSFLRLRWLRAVSPLPETLQMEIIRAYRRLGRPIASDTIDLLGYKISFMGEREFRYLFNEIFMQASYFFKAENDHPIIFDCGSNIGMSVLFFKKLYPNARIVAFEPDPLTFGVLRRNVDQNHLAEVELHQVALGHHKSEVEFYRDAPQNVAKNSSNLTMSTLRGRHSGPSIVVPGRCLSEYISSEVDLLKIDIEGAEEIVMADLGTTGKFQKVKRLHIEYHHHVDASSDNLSRFLRLIEENGFGYQLQASTTPWPSESSFQDISIYCYRKKDGPWSATPV